MRRAVSLFSILVLPGCGSRAATTSTSATPNPTVESLASPTASPVAGKSNQDAVLGPAGMTLQQEIGAVMMVGFTGPPTPAILENWRQHQFGGLIVVPVNQNGGGATASRPLIPSLWGGGRAPFFVPTDPQRGNRLTTRVVR